MNIVSKKKLIAQLEENVEQHLQIVIKEFQNLDTSILVKPSITGGWSIAQCLEHLNKYGDYYLPAISKALERSRNKHVNKETFESTWLGRYFTRMMSPDTGKKKIKAFKKYVPPQSLDAHTVVAEFIAQQEKLLILLRLGREVNLDAVSVPISITKLVRLKLGDVFQFLIAHNERHMLQAKRNLPIGVELHG